MLAILLGCVIQRVSQPPLAIIPFQLLHNEVVARAKINGHGPFTVFLDTGTAPSVIDLSVAKQIGLSLGEVGHSGSGGGTATASFRETTLQDVEIGGLKLRAVAALASDLSGLSRKFGHPIQAVLGDSLFSGRVVQSDYPDHVVRFFAHAPKAVLGKSVAVTFRHKDEVRFSGMLVNRRVAEANLDTGSSGTFSFTPRGVRRLGLTQNVGHAKIQSGAGFNGSYSSRAGVVASIQVGPFTVVGPQVIFWMPGTGHDDSPWDVYVGNAFMKDFVVTIDYRQGKVTFARP
jgi:hypothetical protein